ncbi:MAG: divergent polysaccharide deacetylase family protein, partial [Proteobacteria bacterium]|nr:divergent polysaccharide deacetylase family protein [Pseudomonadota bacterium]
NEWDDRAAIARQLARLEAVALRRGSAIGIGHPHRATLDVLARWLPAARARGFAIVPVSAIVRHRLGIGRQYVETSG